MADQYYEEKDREFNYEGDPKYSIVDITFSTKDTKELKNLNVMSNLRVKIDKLKDRLEASIKNMKKLKGKELT